MATININVNKRKLEALGKEYTINDVVNDTVLDIMLGDSLGIEPTTLTSINSTGFTLGSLTIDVNQIIFNPNGTIGTSQFQYTITDSELTTSTTVVVITTI